MKEKSLFVWLLSSASLVILSVVAISAFFLHSMWEEHKCESAALKVKQQQSLLALRENLPAISEKESNALSVFSRHSKEFSQAFYSMNRGGMMFEEAERHLYRRKGKEIVQGTKSLIARQNERNSPRLVIASVARTVREMHVEQQNFTQNFGNEILWISEGLQLFDRMENNVNMLLSSSEADASKGLQQFQENIKNYQTLLIDGRKQLKTLSSRTPKDRRRKSAAQNLWHEHVAYTKYLAKSTEDLEHSVQSLMTEHLEAEKLQGDIAILQELLNKLPDAETDCPLVL